MPPVTVMDLGAQIQVVVVMAAATMAVTVLAAEARVGTAGVALGGREMGVALAAWGLTAVTVAVHSVEVALVEEKAPVAPAVGQARSRP